MGEACKHESRVSRAALGALFSGAREKLEAQQETHARLSMTLNEHVKGQTMAEEEIKHLRQKLSV